MHRSSQRDPVKEQFWRHAFQDWKASGQTRHQFCLERGLSPHAFGYWRSEIARRDAEVRPATKPPVSKPEPQAKSLSAEPLLMPVRIVTVSPLEVRLADGRSILVPAGFDPQHLQAVLAALESKPC